MNSLRDHAQSIWMAGVDAVRARPLVSSAVSVDKRQLRIAEHHWDLDRFDRVIVIGAGKAATSMTEGLLDSLNGLLPVVGWINVPEGMERSIDGVVVHPARPAGVNEPTAEGVRGTEAILALVEQAGERDLCIALISGGGSALMPAPAEGVTLTDKLAVTRFLSAAGANIAELNTVRKHISRVKGGGLAAASRAGELITLVLSDVLGDPLDLIASGPTVRDTSMPADAVEVLERYFAIAGNDRTESVQRIVDFLKTQCQAKTFPAAEPTTIVIGSNLVSVEASAARARELGYECYAESAIECEGLADELGVSLAGEVLRRLADTEMRRPVCLITGGEPTVKLADAEVRGKGGRNQQLVLSAYQQLRKGDLCDEDWQRIAVLSGGTDGEDGPTDAAGALIDFQVHNAIKRMKLDGETCLRRNDAYAFFHSSDGLIITGPTGTNVCDVRVVLIDCKESLARKGAQPSR